MSPRARARPVAGALALLLCAGGAAAKVLYDQPTARVVRNDYSPGVRSHRHMHPYGRFVLVLSGGTLRVRTEELKDPAAPVLPGRPPAMVTTERDVTLPTGAVTFRCGETHSLENTGSTAISLVEVEMKEADGTACVPEDSVNAAADSETSGSGRVLFRNRFGAVVLHRIEPQAPFTPAESGRDRIVLWKTPASLRLDLPDGTERLVSHTTAEFDWEPGGHERPAVNVGREPVEALELLIAHTLPRRRMTIRGMDSMSPEPANPK